jgi:membrane associated rhomboid family serine protease
MRKIRRSLNLQLLVTSPVAGCIVNEQKSMEPKKLILLGFFLVLFGFIAPFLMVIGVFNPTFTLSFISFAASVSGLFLGIIGAAYYTVSRRKRDS